MMTARADGTGIAALTSGLARPRQRPRAPAVWAALALHVVLLGALWYSGRVIGSQLPEFRTYRVSLASPPPQVAGPATPVQEAPQIVPPATPAPAPEPATRQPEPAVVPAPAVPRTPPAERTPPQPTPPPDATPARQPEAVAGNNPQPVAVGGDGVNVQMDGADFPFPGYLENVIRQIHNHFRWDGAGTFEAQVHFHILRDGSVGGIRVVSGSGNVRFDLAATSAVEQAGRRGAFGSLPAGWQADRLWVSFRFLPPR